MDEFEGPWGGPPPGRPKKGFRLGLLLWLGLLIATGGVFLLLARLFPGGRSGADWGEAVRLFGLLALVSVGLVSMRRLDLGRTARNIAGWVAIFGLVLVAYAFRDELLAAGLRVRSALIPAYAVADSPRSMVVGRGEDDGFYVFGDADGARVRFLIDTGASDIVLSPADAERAGLPIASLKFSRPGETANGVGYGAPATLKSLVVGPIRLTDVPVLVNRAPMTASLLGTQFLKRLDAFEVRGDRLFLRGRG